MQCRYHGWTYRLDGTLLRAPEMEGTEASTRGDFTLLPVQVATWGPLVFANLDLKAPPLAHFLEEIRERTARFQPEQMRFVMQRWTIQCNWKVYVDNYLEGYHLPVVHPGLLQGARLRSVSRRAAPLLLAPARAAARRSMAPSASTCPMARATTRSTTGSSPT